MQYCTHCGSGVGTGASYCWHCGTALPNSQDVSRQPPNPEQSAATTHHPEDGAFSYALSLPYAGGYRALLFGTGLWVGLTIVTWLLVEVTVEGVFGFQLPTTRFLGSSLPVTSPAPMVRILLETIQQGAVVRALLLVVVLCGYNIAYAPMLGYASRLAASAADGARSQPAFADLKALTLTGGRFISLGLVVALFLTGIEAVVYGQEIAEYASIPAVIALYVHPAIHVTHAVDGIQSGPVIELIADPKYAVAFLVYICAIGLGGILLVLVSVMLVFTIIGILLLLPLWTFGTTYFFYFSGSYWGAVYYRLIDEREPYQTERVDYW